MNYYEHHLGDWAAATGHLTWDEDMAYTRLLRAYYHHERAIPDGQQYRLAKASTPAQRKAVDQVLAEFFELRDGHHHQKRADTEISRFQDKQRKAKASADARWSQSGRNANALQTQDENEGEKASAKRKDSEPYKNGQEVTQPEIEGKSLISLADVDSNAMRTHSEGNALQSPDTRPNTKNKGGDHSTAVPPAKADHPPFLPDGKPEPEDLPGGGHREADAPPQPSLAGRACLAMRGANIHDVNPSHPDLLRLLAAGVTPEDIGATAAECAARGKGRMAYVLRTVESRRADAAKAPAVAAARPVQATTVPSAEADRTAAHLEAQANRGHTKPSAEMRAKLKAAAAAVMGT